MKITICGSSEFVEDMKKAADYLSTKGHIVFLPEPLISETDYLKENTKEKLLEMKPVFTQNHFKKIENSDAILIINHKRKGFEGYFGSNTLMEISVAFYLGKKIFILNPIQEDLPHYEEIVGLNSIILNGDLTKIK